MTTQERPAPERVLLAEDQSTYREQMAALLEGAGLRVERAANGREAILLITSAKRYDLLVTDLQMPHGGGFEVVDAWLRAGHSARRVVMVSSAADSVGVQMRAEELGIGLLSKADIGARLLREVQRALAWQG